MNIQIDSEFKSLIPSLTDEEYDGLRDSILNEGCRDALVVWNGVLVDGHNRYEICEKHGIPYDVVEMEFENRNDAKAWIIKNQFSRRNLPKYEHARLALMLEQLFAEIAKERQGTRNDLVNIPQKSAGSDTRDELARIAGVSHDTIDKVKHIENEAPSAVVEASRKGEISVNSGYQVTKLEPEEQEEIANRIEQGESPKATVQEVLKRPHVSFNSGNNEWYTPPEFIEAAREVMGSIDVDPASSDIAQEVVKADRYYTAETNGLDKTWDGNIWMNPPYASDLIGKFIDKLVDERKNYQQAIVLVNNATETEWFNKIISIASAVCFPKSRVKFYMPDGKTGAPLQGQAVIYIGENIEKFTETFKKLGWIAVIHGLFID